MSLLNKAETVRSAEAPEASIAPPTARVGNPGQYYQLGPIAGGALNRQATRVGIPKGAQLTIAETQALRERAVALLNAALAHNPEAGPSALAEPIAATLVEEAEKAKLAQR
jgi:hypothetical protein